MTQPPDHLLDEIKERLRKDPIIVYRLFKIFGFQFYALKVAKLHQPSAELQAWMEGRG